MQKIINIAITQLPIDDFNINNEITAITEAL